MTKKQREKKPPASARISIGRDVGAGAAIGPGARVTANNIAGHDLDIGASAGSIVDAFARIYAAIESRPFSSKPDAQYVREIVELIEEENKKGNDANGKVVSSGFNSLARMAPDILEVVIATLCSPIAGISTVVKKIAEKAKRESKSGTRS